MKLIPLVLMIAYSILVLAIGMPVFETSRQEARLAQAYMQARQIKSGTLPVDTVDPWGTPFRIIKDDHSKIVQVISSGPNRSSGAVEYDDDDIVSDIASPPHQVIMLRKHFQLLLSLSLSACPWLMAAFMSLRSLIQRPRQSISVVSSSRSHLASAE